MLPDWEAFQTDDGNERRDFERENREPDLKYVVAVRMGTNPSGAPQASGTFTTPRPRRRRGTSRRAARDVERPKKIARFEWQSGRTSLETLESRAAQTEIEIETERERERKREKERESAREGPPSDRENLGESKT